MNRGHRARLYLTPEQAHTLGRWAGCARLLWNIARDQRRWGRGHLIGKSSQCRELTGLRAELDWLAELPAQVAQQVFSELDLAFQRCWLGLTGYPQRKRKGRSLAVLRFPQDVQVRRLNKRWGEVKLPKLGWLRFRWTRSLDGTLKNVTLTQQYGEWYVCFSLEVPEPEPLPPSDLVVGIDVGLTSFAVLSTGAEIANPRYFRLAERRLRLAQRKLARRQRRSRRRQKARQQVARVHQHVADQRRDFLHKTARQLVIDHGLIAVEDLNVKGLAVSMLAKSVNDAGWSQFVSSLSDKAAEAGRTLVKVNPAGTTRDCSRCGEHVPKRLWRSEHIRAMPAGWSWAVI